MNKVLLVVLNQAFLHRSGGKNYIENPGPLTVSELYVKGPTLFCLLPIYVLAKGNAK